MNEDAAPERAPARQAAAVTARPGRLGRRRDGRRPAPGATAREAPDGLIASIAEELRAACRLSRLLADDEVHEDEVVEWLCVAAMAPGVSVRPGCERAWLLRTLLRFLGADADGSQAAATRRDRDLPRLRTRSPMPSHDQEIDVEAFERLLDALGPMDRQSRASLLLVVHEGLSVADGARVQGGTRGSFLRRYEVALASLDADLVDILIGQSLGGPQVA